MQKGKLLFNMSCIIFTNWPHTNYMDKVWAKAKREENQRSELMLIEDYFPMASVKRKAQILGVSEGYYYELRRKYTTKEKRI